MSPSPARRPNVLFILSDDQRFDTISALGNPHIHTPHLDDLAHRGTAFARHFCTTPICTPARAEILTGCQSFRNQVPWFGMPINPELVLLPQVFQGAGYHTIHVGKWHNDGHPRDKGYDQTHCVFPSDNLNDYRQRGHYLRFDTAAGEVEGHATELFTEAALQALQAAPGDRPWLCYLAYTAPHDPHDSPEPFNSFYRPENMPLLPNYMPEHPFDNGVMDIRDELLESWPREQEAMRRYRCRYYGMISHLDHNVGRVLGLLRRQGALDNTIVVFTGDQGLAIGSHGLLGKENMYDHSIASPLLLSGPGIVSGGRSEALSHHTDLLPTLCELTGIPRPATATDGHSLGSILRGEAERVREEVFCEFCLPEGRRGPLRHRQRALRTERWKLTWHPDIGRYQLFDVGRDPYELVDLLLPWRTRYRKAVAAGGAAWGRDTWANWDPRPEYRQEELEAVVTDLHARLVRQMQAHEDPLLAEITPPAPDWGA
jgi:arylsulfatase A-like enzyme